VDRGVVGGARGRQRVRIRELDLHRDGVGTRRQVVDRGLVVEPALDLVGDPGGRTARRRVDDDHVHAQRRGRLREHPPELPPADDAQRVC